MKDLLKIYERNKNFLLQEIAQAMILVETAKIKLGCFDATLDQINLTKINDCFLKLKLDATVRTIGQNGKTGVDFKENDLTIELLAVPMPGSAIKPVVFRGYTSGGSSTNAKQRTDRSRKLEAKILEMTGLVCHINAYSMEIKSIGDPFSVMITLVVPNPKKNISEKSVPIDGQLPHRSKYA